MKKLLVLGLTVTVIFAFVVAFSFALAGESTTTAKTPAAKSCCPGSTKACAPGAGGAMGAACTPEQMAVCSAQLGLSAEECANYCKSDKYQVLRLSVTGMTDAAGEEAVRSTLTATPGVEKVGLVSSANNLAVVVFNSADPSITKNAVQALELKGYKTDVAPVEASAPQTEAKMVSTKKGCAATCGAAAAAACGAKKETCAMSKPAETKKSDK